MGRRRRKKHNFRHAKSVLTISGVVIMLTVVLSWTSGSLKEKNAEYRAEEARLQQAMVEVEERRKEIDVLEERVGTDEYVKEIASEILGLVDLGVISVRAE